MNTLHTAFYKVWLLKTLKNGRGVKHEKLSYGSSITFYGTQLNIKSYAGNITVYINCITTADSKITRT